MNYNRGFCRTGYDLNGQSRSGCNITHANVPMRRNMLGGRDLCDSDRHSSPHLAMVYSPRQEWKDIYCGEKALVKGTLFAELD
ncbi:MAG: spore coat associated protein CotJA [Clostridia bacterium]|nr:spore coat associated protein CotJA [Clostridia bacterium]